MVRLPYGQMVRYSDGQNIIIRCWFYSEDDLQTSKSDDALIMRMTRESRFNPESHQCNDESSCSTKGRVPSWNTFLPLLCSGHHHLKFQFQNLIQIYPTSQNVFSQKDINFVSLTSSCELCWFSTKETSDTGVMMETIVPTKVWKISPMPNLILMLILIVSLNSFWSRTFARALGSSLRKDAWGWVVQTDQYTKHIFLFLAICALGGN